MKRLFFAVSIAVAMAACSNNENASSTGGNTADSSGHSGAHANATNPPVSQPMDTSASSGKDMMTLMHENMAQMKATPSTGNPDNDFAALMKIHHLGALDMAQAQIARGTDTDLKAMAQKMINEQQREIAELNTFLSGHNAHGGGDAFYKEVMAQMGNMKMDMDHSGSVDKQFVQMMIPHHQGAIDMARAYLKSGAHEEKLKTMASKIITDQQKEIGELQAWLAKNK